MTYFLCAFRFLILNIQNMNFRILIFRDVFFRKTIPDKVFNMFIAASYRINWFHISYSRICAAIDIYTSQIFLDISNYLIITFPQINNQCTASSNFSMLQLNIPYWLFLSLCFYLPAKCVQGVWIIPYITESWSKWCGVYRWCAAIYWSFAKHPILQESHFLPPECSSMEAPASFFPFGRRQKQQQLIETLIHHLFRARRTSNFIFGIKFTFKTHLLTMNLFYKISNFKFILKSKQT